MPSSGLARIWRRPGITSRPMPAATSAIRLLLALTRSIRASCCANSPTVPGKPFDVRKIEKSRTDILNLNLFSAVEFDAGNDPLHPHVVPITITVQEKAKHSLNLALGYNTQTELNAQLSWNNYNFLGDGRQLLITGTYSQITTALDVKLIQPHFFSRRRAPDS